MCIIKASIILKRSGFSLIELLVVLLLISVVTATVSIQWSGIYRKATFQAEIERVMDFDFKVRRHAADRNQVCQLVVDLDAQKISASRWVSGQERFVTLQLDEGIEVSCLRTVDGSATDGRRILVVGSRGEAPTYAFEFSQNNNIEWVLFAGRTGQTGAFDSKQIEEVFKSLRVQGVSQ